MSFGISEELLPVFVPIVTYWIAAGIYNLVSIPDEKHKLFSKEEETQNLATRHQVFVGVVVNQAVQMALAAIYFMNAGGKAAAAATPPPSLLRIAGQLASAMLIMDAWEHIWHRWTHENRFLYKHVHAMHHQLIVPTLRRPHCHPLLRHVANDSHRLLQSSQHQGVDDHCGLWFPNHPIHRFMSNNAAFHIIHHQHYGVKHNYSVHFLATWDLLLGTYLPYSVEERKGGGYEIRTPKNY
ncbi:unnamed protein product [Spirodela intermedia]|uniref:Uncharacterized protein n=1 Tax=Spirodela intermedia TaxID=51605 RepID=A0A7I8JAJ9_SPIIN|nr:unnamed protein product [Spirodela intermedia]CAA6667114.1 unnamed protein product [Spirodela intermedia]